MPVLNDTLKEIASISLQNDYHRCSDEGVKPLVFVSLSEKECSDLAKKISLLPFEYRSVLYFKYCFHQSAADVETILGIDQVRGKLRYTQELLALCLKIENEFIDIKSMKTACIIALLEEIDDHSILKVSSHYSLSLRKKLRDMGIVQSRATSIFLYVKRVAIILVLIAFSISTALVASAELRESFYGWIVESFPKFSVFSPQLNKVEIINHSIEVGYLPEDMVFACQIDLHEETILEYHDNNEHRLTISASYSENIAYALNTENALLTQIIINNNIACWWEKNNTIFLIWKQDDISYSIIGNIDFEQIIKIAENIKNK